jgi:hypothetical protein
MKINILSHVLRLIIACFLFTTSELAAQKRVLSVPVACKEPLDYGVGTLPPDMNTKDKETPWLVVSDRDGNKVYAEASESSSVIRVINFRDAFYVLQEKGEWIQLVDADIYGSLKIPDSKPATVVGWIHRKNMLLWTSGLLNLHTKIHQKVCLLNRADYSHEADDSLQKVDIYHGPTAKPSGKSINIYTFYFILKKEEDRYLLCEEDAFNKLYLDKIVGWVKSSRCADWNTRIALEPNFEVEAFEERKLTPAFQLHGYEDRDDALQYAKSGDTKPNSGRLLWDKDIVNLAPNDKQLAKANPKRYVGSKLRFPVMAAEEGSGLNKDVFRTGVLGLIQVTRNAEGSILYGKTIPENVWAQIKKYQEKAKKAANNINVCFVIEGSASMAGYKDQITAGIKNIVDEYQGRVINLQFSAVIYRGPFEKGLVLQGQKVDKRLEYTPLTPDPDKVAAWISEREFASWNDNLDYKALYYGVSKTLEKINFEEGATNIMIVVGNFGDYRADRLTNEALAKDETRVVTAELTKTLAKNKIHLYAVQCINNEQEESIWFGRHMQYLIHQSALNGYLNNFGNKTDGDAAQLRTLTKQNDEPPKMPEEDKEIRLALEKAYLWPGAIIRSKGAQPPAGVQSHILSFFKESFDRIAWLDSEAKRIIDDGEAMNTSGPEDFPADLAAFLYDMAKQGKVPFEHVKSLTGAKQQIFIEEFFPQQVSTAKHPMFSYVLFMPESDLNRYQQLIRNKIGENKPVSKMRDDLESIYKELVEQFTGINKRPKDFRKLSVSDVSAVVQGVYGEGLKLSVPIDVVIKDLKNERLTPDSVIMQLNNRFREVDKKIDDILRKGEKYEFKYNSGLSTYYWIPVEDMF